jgi:acyl-CoA reductase-like NAD-dependent aldehyde dehydrogenase
MAPMLETVNPATGEVLAVFPVQGRREVDAVVAEGAQPAALWWAKCPISERRLVLLAWKSHLTRYIGRIAQLAHAETGKSLDEAKLEVIRAITRIDWVARHARPVLAPRRVRQGPAGGLLASEPPAVVCYEPLGVVGVIGPADNPVLTPVRSIVCALAAGNAVVFKPSELTPAVGEWLVHSFGEALRACGNDGAPAVLQGVYGPVTTAAALAAQSGVAKIVFSGPRESARPILAAAAEALTPVVVWSGAAAEGPGQSSTADGSDELREFARAKVSAGRRRLRLPARLALPSLATAGRTPREVERLVTTVTLLHGRLYRARPTLARRLPLLGRRAQAARDQR